MMTPPRSPPAGIPAQHWFWFEARREEERRNQEAEKSRQEAMKLERRKVEHSILGDALCAGMSPNLAPMLMGCLNGLVTGRLSPESAPKELPITVQRMLQAKVPVDFQQSHVQVPASPHQLVQAASPMNAQGLNTQHLSSEHQQAQELACQPQKGLEASKSARSPSPTAFFGPRANDFIRSFEADITNQAESSRQTQCSPTSHHSQQSPFNRRDKNRGRKCDRAAPRGPSHRPPTSAANEPLLFQPTTPYYPTRPFVNRTLDGERVQPPFQGIQSSQCSHESESGKSDNEDDRYDSQGEDYDSHDEGYESPDEESDSQDDEKCSHEGTDYEDEEYDSEEEYDDSEEDDDTSEGFDSDADD
ncbi:hypothetical protein POX_b03085 [Penicillium oxalicum]|uniref:hypothetical protein n=1 Tax=Penicillium oxalicum TaxID=69781 RepID=UPI0020B6D9B2|nr:hypothetical protein POX_b03085 [Penicillium oxalicum]KAI2793038.1 hypothetical protein POX_b03085 [Penicillium oxalicum]